MSVANRLLSGILSSWAHFFVAAAISFIIAPLLVHRLGNESYGLWSLYMTIIGYFTLFDFGLSPAILKYSSKYQALGDARAEQRVIATSLCLLTGIAGIILALVGLGSLGYSYIFPPTQVPVEVASLAFLFVGLAFVFSLPFSTFRGILLGHQRYLSLNGVLIFNRIATLILILGLVHEGQAGLVAMSLIFLGTGMFKDIALLFLTRSRLPARPHLRDFRWDTARDLMSYSFPAFVVSVAMRLISYTDSLVIGYVIGVGAVTYFALAASLVDYVNEIGWSLARVLIPVVSAHEARGEIEAIQQRYLQFTRYCVWLITPILFGCMLLGRAFFTRWIGPDYISSAQILSILIVASAAYVIQQPAHAVLRGMSLHQLIAWFMALEAVINLVLSIILARSIGLVGVALGTLIPRVLLNGILLPIYTLKTLKVPFRSYWHKGFVPALPGTGALFLLTLVSWTWISDDLSWLSIVFWSILYVVTFAGATFLFGAEPQERVWVLERLQKAMHKVQGTR